MTTRTVEQGPERIADKVEIPRESLEHLDQLVQDLQKDRETHAGWAGSGDVRTDCARAQLIHGAERLAALAEKYQSVRQHLGEGEKIVFNPVAYSERVLDVRIGGHLTVAMTQAEVGVLTAAILPQAAMAIGESLRNGCPVVLRLKKDGNAL